MTSPKFLYTLKYTLSLVVFIYACKAPNVIQAPALKELPSNYSNFIQQDTNNISKIEWKQFFSDKTLEALIDTALKNNLDVLTTLQEIEIAKNKVKYANGKFVPTINGGTNLALEKVGRYTSQGAGDASADITPGNTVPELLPSINFGFQASWEADVWGKLKNEKQAAYLRYLSTEAGKNLVITNLIAEIASSYYELLGLENQLAIVRNSIDLQNKELEIVKAQQEAAVVTTLAVKQFEAQLYNTQNLEFNILQNIIETQNKINLLLGRYPQKISVDTKNILQTIPTIIKTGVPSQLLKNRPDIKQAELELQAANCDIKAARAEFYPAFNIGSTLGFSAFKPAYLLRTPESVMYSLASDITGPIVNKSAIKANFATANALQIEAMYSYQKSIFNGFVDVNNQLSNLENLSKAHDLKLKEANALNEAVDVSNDLFKYGRANYLEVIMAQKEALNTQLELIDVKKQKLQALTSIYKALGGGW